MPILFFLDFKFVSLYRGPKKLRISGGEGKSQVPTLNTPLLTSLGKGASVQVGEGDEMLKR